MANFGPSKTWTDGEVLSHTDLNASLLDIINNVTNNNINADNIDETDDYAWSGVNSFSGGHSIKVLSNAAGSIVTGTTLEWDPADGGQMTDNSSGISIDFKLPDASDNQDVFASIAAICLDDAAGSEDGELSFRVAVGGTNTEKMTLSNSALTVTPAITASGGVSGSVTSSNVSITGGSISGITDLAVADGGTGASTASAARTNLGLAIGSDVQAYDAELQALSGLTPTDNNIIVGNGSTFVTESGATARTSLGLGSIATQASDSVSITGGSVTGITDITVADGGTGASNASGARTNLGVAIGSDVQAYDAGLAAIAGLAVTDGNIIVGNGSTWVAESAGTARTSLGLGSIATQAADAVSISGGSLAGMTSYSGGSFSGTTGTFSGDVAVNSDTLFVDVSEDRVGINSTSPDHTLHVKSTADDAVVEVESSASNSNPVFRLKNDAREWQWQLRGAESDSLVAWDVTGEGGRLYIDTSGNVLIGYTSSQGSYKLQVNSQIFATNSTIATSDERYKEDVQTLSNATDLVSRLNPVQFKWKKHEIHNLDVGKTDVGFIAQEVQAVLSDTDYSDSVVVSNKTDDEEYLGLGETKLIPLLTAAIQELTHRVAELENN